MATFAEILVENLAEILVKHDNETETKDKIIKTESENIEMTQENK